MNGQKYFYYISLKKNFVPEKELEKYIFKQNHCLYATTYEEVGNKVKLGIYNYNGNTKESWVDNFVVDKKYIAEVEKVD